MRPRGVRVHVNGLVHDLDDTLRYLGVRDGLQVWRVTGPAHVRFTEAPELHVAALPPQCTLDMLMVRVSDGTMRFGADTEEGSGAGEQQT